MCAQVMVIPISQGAHEYAAEVRRELRAAHLQVVVDLADKKMQKKVAEAQTAQYNYILVRTSCWPCQASAGLIQATHAVHTESRLPAEQCLPPQCMQRVVTADICTGSAQLRRTGMRMVDMHTLPVLASWHAHQAPIRLPSKLHTIRMCAGGRGEGEGGEPGERAHARQQGARHARPARRHPPAVQRTRRAASHVHLWGGRPGAVTVCVLRQADWLHEQWLEQLWRQLHRQPLLVHVQLEHLVLHPELLLERLCTWSTWCSLQGAALRRVSACRTPRPLRRRWHCL